MKQVVGMLALLALISCSLASFSLSRMAEAVGPAAIEAAPGVIREYRRTDTLDELQQFQELERPNRPVWPFILALSMVILTMLLIQSPSILKQSNSMIRQFKRRGGGRRNSNGSASNKLPPQPPIILPPGYGREQRALPPGRAGDEW